MEHKQGAKNCEVRVKLTTKTNCNNKKAKHIRMAKIKFYIIQFY